MKIIQEKWDEEFVRGTCLVVGKTAVAKSRTCVCEEGEYASNALANAIEFGVE